MRRIQTGFLVLAIMVIPVSAFAAVDLGNGACLDEAKNTQGVWVAGLHESDADCITEAEYAELFSVENLVETGVADAAVLNDDGTTTLSINGAQVVVDSDPLDRPVAANPSEFDTAPTVREVLFPDRRASRVVLPL